MLAVGAPTRWMPAKRATMGTTVATPAMTATAVQPSAVRGWGRPPLDEPGDGEGDGRAGGHQRGQQHRMHGRHHPFAGQDVAGVDGRRSQTEGQADRVDTAGQRSGEHPETPSVASPSAPSRRGDGASRPPASAATVTMAG